MSLNSYIEKKVCIITTDGRNLVGVLASHDQTTNLVRSSSPFHFPQQLPPRPPSVLKNTVERVIRTPDDSEPSAEVPLGLYIVRGENVCLVGLVDEPLDASINWTAVKGDPIGTTKH
ncbi:U6 snRNA-associated Sm-like protein LSm8 [Diplogelasinospora grovesii]|uniref:LSM2-LSM8 complex subunit LSM8 n=1 Tax=Diplogelasinospora grovesii TaxID=303347 RepID=A0AAN6NGE2_9PEZI|nr:U6 snRNA-associated Sm-like protein LSm8 [Diplogelasinospora grovesii]